jgi:hypothetical protein
VHLPEAALTAQPNWCECVGTSVGVVLRGADEAGISRICPAGEEGRDSVRFRCPGEATGGEYEKRRMSLVQFPNDRANAVSRGCSMTGIIDGALTGRPAA